MDIYAGKDWIVIWGHNERRDYDRVEGSIGRSYDEIKGVTMSVSRDFHMLGKITTGKKVEKLECLSTAEVVDMDVEVAVMLNSWGVVAAWERNDENWLRNVEKGWEYGGVVDRRWTMWVELWKILEL